jgi:hypothetical protein
MQTFKKWMFLIVLTGFLGPRAFAYDPEEGKVTATFGPLVYRTNFSDPASGLNSPWQTDLGLVVLGDVSSKGSLEIAIFHMNKLYFRSGDGYYAEAQTQLIHVTMGYRRWWSHYFSTALAFYSAYSIGDPKILSSDFPVGQTPDTSARDYTEYGLDFSIQTDLWSNTKWGVVLDARYAYSLTSKPQEHGDHYGFLLGVRYMIQEKDNPVIEKP